MCTRADSSDVGHAKWYTGWPAQVSRSAILLGNLLVLPWPLAVQAIIEALSVLRFYRAYSSEVDQVKLEDTAIPCLLTYAKEAHNTVDPPGARWRCRHGAGTALWPCCLHTVWTCSF